MSEPYSQFPVKVSQQSYHEISLSGVKTQKNILFSQQLQAQQIQTVAGQQTQEDKYKSNCNWALRVSVLAFCLFFVAYFVVILGAKPPKSYATLIFTTSSVESLALSSLRTHLQNPIVQKSVVYINTNYSLTNFFSSLESNLSMGKQVRIFNRSGELRVSEVDKMINEVKSDIILLLTSQQTIYRMNRVPYELLQANQNVFQVISNHISQSQDKITSSSTSLKQIGFIFGSSFINKNEYQKNKGGFSELTGSQCVIEFKNRQCEQAISKYYLSNKQTCLVFEQFRTFSTDKINFQSQTLSNSSLQQNSSDFKIVNNGYFQILSKSLIQGKKVINDLNLQPQQLPFCLMVSAVSEQLSAIKASILRQNYKNYQIIQYQGEYKLESEKNIQKYSYQYFVKLIKQKCVRNPIVMFLNQPLQDDSLPYLNSLHQNYMAWVLYIKEYSKLQIVSFLFRVYELIKSNDFTKKNAKYLDQHNLNFEATAMLELCNDFTKKVVKQKVYRDLSKDSYFFITKDTLQRLNYKKYSKIIRLSQDMQIESKMYSLSRRFQKITSIPKRANLTMDNMLKAIQRSEEWYLPEGHLIEKLQLEQFSKKYNITDYVAIDKQVRFCVTIVSRNNVQNNRFKKVIDSVVGQKYSNYHIVFLDDFSKDGNLQASFNYLKQIGFPSNRLNIVKGLKRNFATYNIINAAFNYCGQDEIQLMMDGDDEIIGKYAFQVINSAYQQNPDLWIVYSNHKTSYYNFGISKTFRSDEDHLNIVNNTRKPVSILAPIRSWRTKVICHIPLIHHQLPKGEWLDIVSDDALLHPLLQLASANRTKYINEIMYEYNVNYGGTNINRTPQKNKYRKNIYSYLLTLTPLQRLQSLDEATKNEQISKILKKDKGIKYIELNY